MTDGILLGVQRVKDTLNSKTNSKINSWSKPKNPLQAAVQGTEHSYHSFIIHPGSDKLLEKTQHHQFVELNSNIHAYNTQRKRDIHIQSYRTDLYKRSVINMGFKLYNKLPDYIKETESYKTFRKQLKSFLLRHAFYSVEECVAL
jgi:hypothetical protein